MAQVADQIVEPAGDVGLVDALGLDDWIAESQARAAPGVLVAQAAGAFLVGALGQVKRDLAVDVTPDTVGPEDVRQTPEP
ncbi:hypothetical protein D3C83_70460 [compost metagenome]